MKTILIIIAVILSISVAFGLNAYQQSRLHQQQLADYEQHVKQLLSQVETNALQRLTNEKQVDELESELTMLTSQLTSVLNQLQIAQSQADPDYQELETEIRRRITNEFQALADISPSKSRLNLVKQLTSLNAVELGEIMSIQGQFGGFLESLQVGDERMEIIVDALGNLIADQNQARMSLMMEVTSQDVNRREMRSQMRAISSPEAQLETLSFVLTDNEMSVLEEFQATQANQQNEVRAFMTNPITAGDATGFRFWGRGQRGRGNDDTIFRIDSGSGTADAIRIQPVNPPQNR